MVSARVMCFVWIYTCIYVGGHTFLCGMCVHCMSVGVVWVCVRYMCGICFHVQQACIWCVWGGMCYVGYEWNVVCI